MAVISLDASCTGCAGSLTNSLTIFDEPFRASLCTLDSSLLDDLDFDLDADLDADVDLDVEELVLVDLVVLGSDILGAVVLINGLRGWMIWWFVDGEAVDAATLAEAAVSVRDAAAHNKRRRRCNDEQKRVQAGITHVRPMLADGCGVVVCGEQ